LTLSNDCKHQHILFRSNELAYNIGEKAWLPIIK
jgi:hypothetical protein